MRWPATQSVGDPENVPCLSWSSWHRLAWGCINLNFPSGNSSIALLTRAQMDRCLDALRGSFGDANVINQRENRIVIRWRWAETGDSIIIKMWSRPDLIGSLRRLLRVAACNHEWRNLVRMSDFGIAVPRPLGFCRVAPSIAGYTDVLFMEDLGKCKSATEHLKQLIQAGQEQQALSFENVQIEMTAQMLEAGMLDVDHGMHNIVVQPSGRPVKLDVELGRQVIWPRLFPAMYGRMLGRMIGMHAFAVQPDVGRMTRFAERLCERLKPSPRILKRAGIHAREMMQKQLQKTGIDTRLILPWD